MSKGEYASYAGMGLVLAALAWLVTWIFAVVVLTSAITESPCPDPNVSYHHEFKDWHMVGPWPIATDYTCRDEK